jgi:fructoselysine-6-P-deglycase FrlB-like protein
MPTGVDFEREIREHPVAMARLLDRGRTIAEEAAHQIRSFAPTFADLGARGSSDNAARYAQLGRRRDHDGQKRGDAR